MNVLIIGMGKIGLPLAVSIAKNGFKVTGLDKNLETIDQINQSEVPFPNEKNLELYLKDVVTSGMLNCSNDSASSISQSNVIIVCIPLLTDENNKIDFENMDKLVYDIAFYMNKGTLISFETTLPVGTTRNRFTNKMQEISGLKIGIDFNVVFSPERVLTGRFFQDLSGYPKIIGGITDECTKKGVAFYKKIIKFSSENEINTLAMSSVESAELTKIVETTYRDVNIGLANEFAKYASDKGINFYEVIKAANSQPFSHIHEPGISVGGHCIPVYPHFYLEDNKDAKIVTASRETNQHMPDFAVDRLKKEFPNLKGYSIGILGLSYRAGVKEISNSGALRLLEILKLDGVTVYGYDPLFTENEIHSLGFMNGKIENLDGLILHTNHQEFLKLNLTDLKKLKFVLDGRNFLPRISQANYKHIDLF
jgi:UDP-N-acetyl-D-glucosamine dehydrogenase